MTTQQKQNIGRGVRAALSRKRRAEAMKASWMRRRENGVTAIEQPTSRQECLWEVAKVLGIDTDAVIRHEIKRVLDI